MDDAEAGGVIASTVVKGSGEMYLRGWILALKALEFRVGFAIFFPWINGRNGVCTISGCVVIAWLFVCFDLPAIFTSTLDFGLGPTEAVSNCLRDGEETYDG